MRFLTIPDSGLFAPAPPHGNEPGTRGGTDGRRDTRKVMIVALARKLLVAFWELVTTGKVPEGMKLHPAPVAA